MVKASEIYTSKYLSAKISGQYNGKKYTIDSVHKESVGMTEEDMKDRLVMRLSGIDKPVVLNSTNNAILSTAFGDETDLWINRAVVLRIVKVSFNGQMVDGIQFEPVN